MKKVELAQNVADLLHVPYLRKNFLDKYICAVGIGAKFDGYNLKRCFKQYPQKLKVMTLFETKII